MCALTMNLTLVGTSRCDAPALAVAGGAIAPLNAARTAQRTVPTGIRVRAGIHHPLVSFLKNPVLNEQTKPEPKMKTTLRLLTSFAVVTALFAVTGCNT